MSSRGGTPLLRRVAGPVEEVSQLEVDSQKFMIARVSLEERLIGAYTFGEALAVTPGGARRTQTALELCDQRLSSAAVLLALHFRELHRWTS
jgi:hypothetical protein